jgi:predicted nucleic acid-binding protein
VVESPFLIDTNIISDLAAQKPNPGVLQWAETVTSVYISAVTVEELSFGLSWKPNPRIEQWIETFIRKKAKVLPITEAIAYRAGTLRGQLKQKGITRTQADIMIAATASQHNLTIVTRNVRDFEGCGVAVLDPFK